MKVGFLTIYFLKNYFCEDFEHCKNGLLVEAVSVKQVQ